MPTSNIDEILLGAKTPIHPQTPEVTDEKMETSEESVNVPHETSTDNSSEYGETSEETIEKKVEPERDDYGNEPEPTRTYTEDEVNSRINQAIRDRFARMEKNQPAQEQQTRQQIQKDFEYNPESQESWQQQLEGFIENTVHKISQKQTQSMYEANEREIKEQFERKFHQGMSKFKDFHAVVGDKQITDAMVIATRGLDNPAAFLYAAAKRAPKELERIANIKDNYAQMVEIGKLEERMKKRPNSSNTPRPSAKIQDDMPVKHKSDKQPTIEELIASSNAKRLAALQRKR